LDREKLSKLDEALASLSGAGLVKEIK
jgi:hypothetical protein